MSAGIAWSLAVLVLLAAPELQARDARSLEYQVKAAFLFNFARFTEWPPASFSSPGAPFVLGVLGEDPFGDNLEQTVSGKSVHSRPLLVKRAATLQELGDCHILFVAGSEKRRLPEILEALKSRAVLTVSDVDDFVRSGGMIRLLPKGDTIRFEINARSAQEVGLKISSKLLRLAENNRDS
jgi:hypothetical protein